MMRSMVVLPDPSGPIKPCSMAGLKEILTPLMALLCPMRFTISIASMPIFGAILNSNVPEYPRPILFLWQIRFQSHSRLQQSIRVFENNLNRVHQAGALRFGLHVLGGELRLVVDMADHPFKGFVFQFRQSPVYLLPVGKFY